MAVVLLTLLGPASARTSKYGGMLVVGQALGSPASLDPTLANGGPVSAEIFLAMCQGLYDVGPKGNVVPLLASALPSISSDKLTYTIPLRKGIVFNDGTPFNAQAVVTTLERDITLPGSLRTNDLSLVDTVTAPDPSSVVIHLKAPFTPLTSLLARDTGLIMSPTQLARLGANFAASPVCVGPFMFDHQVAGDNVTVVKSPYYYGKYGVYLDKIVFKSAPDAASATTALQAGDLQAIDSLSTTQLLGIAESPSLTVSQQDTLGYIALFINIGNRNGNPPYSNVGTPLASNPNLRKAFEEAIDRTALNRVVFGGKEQAGCTPISPVSPWYDPNLACTPYNPTDAKKQIAAAGLSNLTVHLMTANTTDNLRLAQFIQAEEAAVGINVVIDALGNAAAVTQALNGSYDTYISGSPGLIDPDGILYRRNATSGDQNVSGYSNARLDLVLDNARKAITVKARRTLYHVAQQILLNDRPVLYLYHIVRFSAYSNTLSGIELRPDGFLRVAFARYS
jgi:peptide/nickel transport system substrate-binding protein